MNDLAHSARHGIDEGRLFDLRMDAFDAAVRRLRGKAFECCKKAMPASGHPKSWSCVPSADTPHCGIRRRAAARIAHSRPAIQRPVVSLSAGVVRISVTLALRR